MLDIHIYFKIIKKKQDFCCCFETVIGTWPEGLGLFSCLRSREEEEEEEGEVGG